MSVQLVARCAHGGRVIVLVGVCHFCYAMRLKLYQELRARGVPAAAPVDDADIEHRVRPEPQKSGKWIEYRLPYHQAYGSDPSLNLRCAGSGDWTATGTPRMLVTKTARSVGMVRP